MKTSNKILLVGDSCIDTYIFGHCDRLSPEAPVPVFCESSRESRCGMAKNVFKNMLVMGLNIDLITQQEEIEKIRIVSLPTMHHMIRIDNEHSSITPLSLDEINAIDPTVYDACVISDYDKGFIRHAEISELCKLFRDNNKPIFVDSKKTNLECFSDCIIKINLYENKRILSWPKRYELITTLGSKGTLYKEKIFEPYEVDVDKRSTERDVCGAGDTYLAALVKMYLDKKNIELSIPFANYCAALAVNNFGVSVINSKEIKGFLKNE